MERWANIAQLYTSQIMKSCFSSQSTIDVLTIIQAFDAKADVDQTNKEVRLHFCLLCS